VTEELRDSGDKIALVPSNTEFLFEKSKIAREESLKMADMARSIDEKVLFAVVSASGVGLSAVAAILLQQQSLSASKLLIVSGWFFFLSILTGSFAINLASKICNLVSSGLDKSALSFFLSSKVAEAGWEFQEINQEMKIDALRARRLVDEGRFLGDEADLLLKRWESYPEKQSKIENKIQGLEQARSLEDFAVLDDPKEDKKVETLMKGMTGFGIMARVSFLLAIANPLFVVTFGVIMPI
jgi:hypothetical protein